MNRGARLCVSNNQSRSQDAQGYEKPEELFLPRCIVDGVQWVVEKDEQTLGGERWRETELPRLLNTPHPSEQAQNQLRISRGQTFVPAVRILCTCGDGCKQNRREVIDGRPSSWLIGCRMPAQKEHSRVQQRREGHVHCKVNTVDGRVQLAAATVQV